MTRLDNLSLEIGTTDSDTEWEKCLGQLRLALNGVLHPLRLYGQGHYVDTVAEEIVSLAVQLHQKLSGVDMPYHVNSDKLHY